MQIIKYPRYLLSNREFKTSLTKRLKNKISKSPIIEKMIAKTAITKTLAASSLNWILYNSTLVSIYPIKESNKFFTLNKSVKRFFSATATRFNIMLVKGKFLTQKMHKKNVLFANN